MYSMHEIIINSIKVNLHVKSLNMKFSEFVSYFPDGYLLGSSLCHVEILGKTYKSMLTIYDAPLLSLSLSHIIQ